MSTPTPRRRSARLASTTKSKIFPPPENLSAFPEHDDLPSSPSLPRPFPREAQTSPISTMKHQPSTPSTSSAKPPASEMHPSKIHRPSIQPSSAVKHGFRDLNPSTRSEKLLVAAQATPTKQRETTAKHDGFPASPFTFAINRPAMDKGLSPEALNMMDGLREEAAKIKAQIVTDRENEKDQGTAVGDRKIAQPVGKGGRFNAAHMAEFKKMDSIETHPSLFRSSIARFTPGKALKRKMSQSHIEDASDSSASQSSKRSPTKISAPDERTSPAPQSKIPTAANTTTAPSPAKRLKQRLEDDATTNRPDPRESSGIPRPVSSAGPAASTSTSAEAPAKPKPNFAASISAVAKYRQSLGASANNALKSGIARPVDHSSTVKLVKTSNPELPTLKPGFFSKPAQAKTPQVPISEEAPTQTPEEPTQPAPEPSYQSAATPGRTDRLKSILKKSGATPAAKNTPPIASSPSKTPSSTKTSDVSAPVSGGKTPTTPSQKQSKISSRTPRLNAIPPSNQDSPSVKSAMKRVRMFAPGDRYSLLEPATSKAQTTMEVKYPDLTTFSGLSGEEAVPESGEEDPKPAQEPSVPGTFTFRADKTIDFGISKPSFGSAAGQASIRQVRQSLFGSMPGSFNKNAETALEAPTEGDTAGASTPSTASETLSDKENTAARPSSRDGKFQAISHGIGNKKRHRPSPEQEEHSNEDGEEEERATKKRRNETGHQKLTASASRATGPTSSSKAFASSPIKSKPSATRAMPASKTPGHFPNKPAGDAPGRATRSTPSTTASSSTSRVPGYLSATATSSGRSKDTSARKIKQPVRPTDKLKKASAGKPSPAASSSSSSATAKAPTSASAAKTKVPPPVTFRAGGAKTTPVTARGARARAGTTSAKSPAAAAAATKKSRPPARATSTISAARLAELAAPKRR